MMAGVMEDLEDGEIGDSADSDVEIPRECDKAHAIEELEQRSFPRQPPVSADRSYRSQHNPCLDSSGESSSDNEDDLDDSPQKVKVSRMGFPHQTNAPPGGGHGDIFMKAAGDFQKKHNKNMWSKVVTEQDVDETLKKINTLEDDDDDDQDRGVESYNYKSKQLEENTLDHPGNQREEINYEDDFLGGNLYADEDMETGKKEESGDEPDANICEIESFGCGISRKRKIKDRLGKRHSPSKQDSHFKAKKSGKNHRRKVRDRLGDPVKDNDNMDDDQPDQRKSVKDRIGKNTEDETMDSHEAELDTHKNHDTSKTPSNSPTRQDESHNASRKSAKDRLGDKIPWVPVRNATFNLHCKETDEPVDVAAALMKALGEPERLTEVFFQAVTVLGVATALELYYETENIEENGGMLINTGDRRRSPGGVYLQLVKEHIKHDKEKLYAIFPQMDRRKKKFRKKERKGGNQRASRPEPTKTDELPSHMDVFLEKSKSQNTADSMETVQDESTETKDNDATSEPDILEALGENCVDIQLD